MGRVTALWEMLTIAELTARHARPGRVEWIGLRTARRGVVEAVAQAQIGVGGLAGDHRAKPGVRAVSLIQFEHLPVIEALCDGAPTWELLRRNVAVSGLNLAGLKDRPFRLGTALLHGRGVCAPCSRMEEYLGHGGYAAVRGHGGIVAEVLEAGAVALGDEVVPV